MSLGLKGLNTSTLGTSQGLHSVSPWKLLQPEVHYRAMLVLIKKIFQAREISTIDPFDDDAILRKALWKQSHFMMYHPFFANM